MPEWAAAAALLAGLLGMVGLEAVGDKLRASRAGTGVNNQPASKAPRHTPPGCVDAEFDELESTSHDEKLSQVAPNELIDRNEASASLRSACIMHGEHGSVGVSAAEQALAGLILHSGGLRIAAAVVWKHPLQGRCMRAGCTQVQSTCAATYTPGTECGRLSLRGMHHLGLLPHLHSVVGATEQDIIVGAHSLLP